MKREKVILKKLNSLAKTPVYSSDFAAGADLYAATDSDILIAPDQTVMVGTGIAVQIPDGLVGLVYARSGLASKRGVAPANKVGVIDSDYRGEIGVVLINLGQEDFEIKNGDRIAQMVVAPFAQVKWNEVLILDNTVRGEGGYGHTGE